MLKSVVVAFFLLLFDFQCYSQSAKYDTALIKQIKAMFNDDQFWRKEYIKINNKEKSDYDEETINKKWEEADRINEIKAKEIIKRYGYPGYNIVDVYSDDFWAIVQHCDDDVAFQKRVLVLMKKQVDINNANKANYAYLTDRILLNENKKQLYGTQLQRDKKTGKFSPFPLKYPQSVNNLRKQMGLEPLEVYVKNYGL